MRPGAWGSLRHLICVNAWQNPAPEGLAVNGLVEADIHGNGPKGRLLYLPARLRRDGQSPWPYWPSVKPEIRWC